MDVMTLNKARPDMGRRQRREADAEDDATETEAAPDAPEPAADLYALLGYRPSFMTGATIQQWLAVRLIEL